MSLISVANLTKEYRRAKRDKGLKGAVKHLFSRDYSTIKAVDCINFEICSGETVGYIGRNGAGKSTTIKILTGILVPTHGKVEVNGVVPYKKRIDNAKNIGVVFGQRTQLRWDIPVRESFRLLKEVYQVPEGIYQKNVQLFTDILELNGLLETPVRQLSLGQRMKCDLAASFLHNPDIVYLDEPTIGLDIVVKEDVRKFIKTINQEHGTTVVLTTHDLRDIEDICKRIIIVDHGKIIYDGSIEEIRNIFGRYKVFSFEVGNRPLADDISSHLPPGIELQEDRGLHIKVRIDRNIVSPSDATKYIMDKYDVLDIDVKDNSIETVVKKIYKTGLI